MNNQERFDQSQWSIRRGKFESSPDAFQELAIQAKDADSQLFDCMHRELYSLIRLGRSEEARKLIQVARENFKEIDEAMARVDLAEIELDSREEKWNLVLPALERMIDRYSEILHNPKLRDTYQEVQIRRGMEFAFLARFKDALPLLEEATSFDHPLVDGNLYFEQARCYLDQQNGDGARGAFTKALSLGLSDSRASFAHWNLGIILLRSDACAHAVEELRFAEELAGKAGIARDYVYAPMAAAFRRLGMDAEARRYAKLASKRKSYFNFGQYPTSIT